MDGTYQNKYYENIMNLAVGRQDPCQRSEYPPVLIKSSSQYADMNTYTGEDKIL